jgi:hypothetical protein
MCVLRWRYIVITVVLLYMRQLKFWTRVRVAVCGRVAACFRLELRDIRVCVMFRVCSVPLSGWPVYSQESGQQYGGCKQRHA